MRLINKIINSLSLAIVAGTLPMIALAQDAAATASATPAPTGKFDSIRYVLIGLAILLLFVVISLTNSIRAALAIKMKKIKESRAAKNIMSILLIAVVSLTSKALWAQDAVADAAKEVVKEPNFFERLYESMPNDVMITILVILVELIVIFGLVKTQTKLLKDKVVTGIEPAEKKESVFTFVGLMNKLGGYNTDKEVEELDLNHNYDGIRELDNNIPGWWKIAFGSTILFGIIYLFRMFVSGSMPDQETELAIAQKKAEVQLQEYLKNSADNVDENTVVMLDAGGIASGADVYTKNCVACHGAKGEGGIGPNLTDDYWLHKGGIKDVFYSIKYGWPEKGMKPWQSDLSPMQISQVTSYILSLKGTNPPNAKPAQGELYAEGAAAPADGATAAPATSTDDASATAEKLAADTAKADEKK